MAPGPSTEPAAYGPAERQALLALARASIAAGLRAEPFAPELHEQPALLQERRASFVTLQIEGRLRGCIGTLDARRPLALEVVAMARAAAFEDPRFPPLMAPEFEELEIHISVLSPPEPLPVRTEAELLTAVRPGIDGLILEHGHRRATFLPSVWEQLPEPREFLRRLRLKGGMDPEGWPPGMAVWRYTAEGIP